MPKKITRKLEVKSEYTDEEITENIKIWLDALKNGGYSQTKNTLRNKHGSMCCLGVACHVLGAKVVVSGSVGIIEYDDPLNHSAETDLLPKHVQKALGLTSSGGHFAYDSELKAESLFFLNDDENYKFKQIAEIIRSKPTNLFVKDFNF